MASQCQGFHPDPALTQQREIQVFRYQTEELRAQLTALATELASLREWVGRRSRNSPKPPSSDAPGHRHAEALRATSRPRGEKGSGRKWGGLPGHPGSGPEWPPIERVDEVVEHHPKACRHCGSLPVPRESVGDDASGLQGTGS